MGEIVCLNKADGNIIWKVDAHSKYQGEFHTWGVAESPLVIDDKVIYTAGGEQTSVVAFNKITGEEIWKTKCVGGSRTYVSPVVYTNGEIRHILASTSHHVFAIIPETGEVAWQYKQVGEGDDFNRRGTITTNTALCFRSQKKEIL